MSGDLLKEHANLDWGYGVSLEYIKNEIKLLERDGYTHINIVDVYLGITDTELEIEPYKEVEI